MQGSVFMRKQQAAAKPIRVEFLSWRAIRELCRDRPNRSIRCRLQAALKAERVEPLTHLEKNSIPAASHTKCRQQQPPEDYPSLARFAQKGCKHRERFLK